MSLQIFNYLKMKEIEREQYKLFVLTQSSGAKIISSFLRTHYQLKDYNLVYIKCTFTDYTLLGDYIILIKISETLTSGSSKITGRFSQALTRDILEGYTRIYSKVVSNPPH